MTLDALWTIDLSHQVEKVLLDSRQATGSRARLAVHLEHALDLLEANGPQANGAKRLNDLTIYEIRVQDHRLYFDTVPGGRTIAATVLAPKTTGRLPMKTYKVYERRVREHVESIQVAQAQQARRRER